jgi:broad specificity phosphatase PhoE
MTDHPTLNESGTGFLLDGDPWKGKVFQAAMSFHAPEGLAAVRDETGAYHVDLDANPRYTFRFLEACGFYEGVAAVRDGRGWFHIRVDGSPIHERRFRWSGNFQDGRCTVQDQRGFFHVDASGADAYSLRFRYAGDFRNGVAVAHGTGGALHIRKNGEPLNTATYVHAEPFHKGHAVVADEHGFHHVDRTGRPIHPQRFQAAEPFYNGVALCRGWDGGFLRLRVNGTWTHVAASLEPITLAEIRSLLGQGTRIGLFLRHAERDPITRETPNWGNDVLLTERGIADATRLGQELAGTVRFGIWSSPVNRCRQTGEAIARGAGSGASEIRTHTHLGEPGIYFDGSGVHSELMRTDFHAFAGGYLDSGLALGMRPIPEASEQLLAFLDEQVAEADCTVFVTHDFFSAALMSYLGLKAPDRSDWCTYLEGVCLVKNPGATTAFRRFAGIREGGRC